MKKLFLFLFGGDVTVMATKDNIKGGASSGASDSANGWYYHNTTW